MQLLSYLPFVSNIKAATQESAVKKLKTAKTFILVIYLPVLNAVLEIVILKFFY